MATFTKGITFASGDVVTPSKLHQLVDSATVANIVTADIADGAVTTAKIADAQITSAKLAPTVILVPTGAVMPFAMNAAPTGWLECNGDSIPNGNGTIQGKTANFATLYGLIGSTYGAAGKLPDLRGYFVRGAGTNSDGKASNSFGAKQGDAVIAHTHTTGEESASHYHHAVANATGPNGSYTTVNINSSQYIAARAESGGGTTNWSYTLQGVGTVATLGRTSEDVGSHSHTTNSQSPAGATETRPANIALLYCIKF